MTTLNVQFRPRKQEDRSVTLEANPTGKTLLDAIEEPAINTILVRNGHIIQEHTQLEDGETIVVMSAASGG